MLFMIMNKLYSWYFAAIILGVLAATPYAQEPAPVQPQQAVPSAQQSSTVQQSTPAEETNAPRFPPTNDPKEIIRRSVEVDHRALEKARSYTCQHREVLTHLGK